jgi:hypothetical protein
MSDAQWLISSLGIRLASGISAQQIIGNDKSKIPAQSV